MHRLSKTRMHLRCPKYRNGDKILRSYAIALTEMLPVGE